MSRKGDCLDDAPMESFFGSMKSELVHRTRFATREDAKRASFRWIETCDNRQRRHSALGCMTPAQAFEQMTRVARCTLPDRPPWRGNISPLLGGFAQ